MDVILLGDGGDDFARLRGVLRAVNHGAAFLGLRAEPFVQFLHVARRIVLDVCNALDKRAFVHLGKYAVASRAVLDREFIQRTAEKAVLQRRLDLARVAHGRPPISTMWSSSGPCTPIALTRSMSAVRLGPVMKET